MMEEQNSHHHTTKRVPKWPAAIQRSGKGHSKLLQLLRVYITVLAAELLRVVGEARAPARVRRGLAAGRVRWRCRYVRRDCR
jgi:hypothetical protein